MTGGAGQEPQQQREPGHPAGNLQGPQLGSRDPGGLGKLQRPRSVALPDGRGHLELEAGPRTTRPVGDRRPGRRRRQLAQRRPRKCPQRAEDVGRRVR
jgi:hypothetical protein